jgi:hypothetical protein
LKVPKIPDIAIVLMNSLVSLLRESLPVLGNLETILEVDMHGFACLLLHHDVAQMAVAKPEDVVCLSSQCAESTESLNNMIFKSGLFVFPRTCWKAGIFCSIGNSSYLGKIAVMDHHSNSVLFYVMAELVLDVMSGYLPKGTHCVGSSTWESMGRCPPASFPVFLEWI